MNLWIRSILVFLLSVFLSACTSYPPNPTLDAYDPDSGYRFKNLAATNNSDSLFVILTFSGGGTRAAALSYGVMEKLRNTTITWEGQQRRLLDEVDVISSVSGGSFTAAYYGLFHEALFERYEQVFLYRDIEAELKRLVLTPTNWFRLASPTFGRIDLAAEFYSDAIFEKKHFADLLSQGRPYILLNATDMSIGAQFIFDQAQFDLLCSNLNGVQVGRAVAASSNFPVAFTPLTLNNYAGRCGYTKPTWIDQAIKDLHANPPRFNRARIASTYLDAKTRPYIHLLDGGVSDNIGLRGPLVAMQSNDPDWNLPNMINRGKVKKLVVLTVDAKTAPPVEYDQSPSPPRTFEVLSTIATVPMENYSFDTVELLRSMTKEWQKVGQTYQGCQSLLQAQCPQASMPTPPPKIPAVYRIYIGFDQIKDPMRRHYFQTMATSFYLPEAQIDDLRKVAADLLTESEDFQQLVTDLQ